MTDDLVFDGFMPTIQDVKVSKQTASITSEGELLNVHCLYVKTLDHEYYFSVAPETLQKMYFSILKVLTSYE